MEVETTLPIGELEISDVIAFDVYKALEAGLIANAIEKNAPPYSEKSLQIVRRDETGRIVAGFTGKTFWNWLYLDILWVDASLRGQGVGSQLVRAAEDEALRRGCHSAYLWTEDFEGEAFYPKLGYTSFMVKDDFPVGHKRIGYLKRLAA